MFMESYEMKDSTAVTIASQINNVGSAIVLALIAFII